ncbi:uncharacterized protein LOC115230003 [Octopus sinensis]|uniref:Uncharacterized protein LOC115230003 n=1 Tax=Octopus sinensis TaxID=2607531 RepID=A0A6P7U3K4_9MOLL|nr:uncharacterized protein LOC115230003 [Octopus sinensis]
MIFLSIRPHVDHFYTPSKTSHSSSNFESEKWGKICKDSLYTNDRAEIRVDTAIPTESKIQYNKPEIFLYDKKLNQIWLIEIRVTCMDNLKAVEVEKLHKYDILTGELVIIYKSKVKILPIVITWDAIASKYLNIYMDLIAIKDNVLAYIQTIALKKTLEGMFVEYKHGFKDVMTKALILNKDYAVWNTYQSGANSKKRRHDEVTKTEYSEEGKINSKRIMKNDKESNMRQNKYYEQSPVDSDSLSDFDSLEI